MIRTAIQCVTGGSCKGYVCVSPVDMPGAKQTSVVIGGHVCRINESFFPTTTTTYDEVVFVGMHTGGSVALVRAAMLKSQVPEARVSVVSFNAPRTGDAAFASAVKSLGVQHVRVRVGNDHVPSMLWWRYKFDAPAMWLGSRPEWECPSFSGTYSAAESIDLSIDLAVDEFVLVDVN